MSDAVKYVLLTLSLLTGIVCTVLSVIHLFVAGSTQSIPVSTNDLLYIHITSILSLLLVTIAVKGFNIKVINIIISILYLFPVIFYIGVFVDILNDSYENNIWNLTIILMGIYNILIIIFSVLLLIKSKKLNYFPKWL